MTGERLFFGEFAPPFCPTAEVMFWTHLYHRVLQTDHPEQTPMTMASSQKQKMIFDGQTNTLVGTSVVLLKSFGNRTGLCTTGISAGRLGILDFDDDKTPMIASRFLAINGGGFISDYALETLNTHDFNPKIRQQLNTILINMNADYFPQLLVACMEYIKFPVDKRRFVDNVMNAGIYWHDQAFL
jgi:hypothetical protein